MLKIEINPDGESPQELRLLADFINKHADYKEQRLNEYKDIKTCFAEPAEEKMLDTIHDRFNLLLEGDENEVNMKPNFKAIEPEDIDEDDAPVEITETKDAASVFAVNETKDVEASNQELDDAGIPWDARIHSAGKTKLKDGTWRLKKNVDSETYDLVLKEITRGIEFANVEPAEAPISPVLPKRLASPPPPPAIADEQVSPFADFISDATQAIDDKKITQAQLIELIKPHGIQTIPALSMRPDVIPHVHEQLRSLINA